jgi:hypothetical protein
MVIQIFLSVLLAGVAALTAIQRTTSRLLRAAVLSVIALGAFFVWVPEATNRIAEVFGVGRGADVILYTWVVITLALIVFLYLKVARLSRKLTVLTRAVALDHPQRPPHDAHHDDGSGRP